MNRDLSRGRGSVVVRDRAAHKAAHHAHQQRVGMLDARTRALCAPHTTYQTPWTEIGCMVYGHVYDHMAVALCFGLGCVASAGL